MTTEEIVIIMDGRRAEVFRSAADAQEAAIAFNIIDQVASHVAEILAREAAR